MIRLFWFAFCARLVLALKPVPRKARFTDVSSANHSADRLQLLAEAYGGEDLFTGMNPNIADVDDSEADLVKKHDVLDEQPSDSVTAFNPLSQSLPHDAKLSPSLVQSFVDQISRTFLKTPAPGIYGEVSPKGMIKILSALAVRPGEVFYDLGSGAGKFPLVASNIFGMRAKGIELVTKRHVAGCKAIEKLKQLTQKDPSGTVPVGGAELVQGSFFDYDFSDADVVFMNSVEWSPDMMDRLSKMCQGLKPGTKIVTFQKELRGDSYRFDADLSSNLTIPTSWSQRQGGLKVYTKVGKAKVDELKGKKVFPAHAESGVVNADSSCSFQHE